MTGGRREEDNEQSSRVENQLKEVKSGSDPKKSDGEDKEGNINLCNS